MDRRLNGSPRAASSPHGRGTSSLHRFRALARLAFALCIAPAFVCGVLAGLARLGVSVPSHALSKAAWHGVLVLPVFFGTLVSLERAVALGGGRHVAAPVASALAGWVLLTGAPVALAQVLLISAATIASTSVFGLLRRHAALHLSVLALGVCAWWFGNAVWLFTGSALDAVPSWIAFLVLTIAAERLELTRMRPTPRHARASFVVVIVVMLLAIAGSRLAPDFADFALRVFSVCLVALAAWLARYDIARITVHQRGLTRFIAVCLLSGYGWLALSGALGLAGAWAAGHPWHDAALHALTLGFVMSMALGHAPIVLPALARIRVRYHAVFYAPLVALHAALAVRVGGSLVDVFTLRRAGALGNAAALLLFAAVMVATAWAARREARTAFSRSSSSSTTPNERSSS